MYGNRIHSSPIRWLVWACLTGLLLVLAPTAHAEVPPRVLEIFETKGCKGCHIVTGIPGAVGQIGPKLDGLGNKARIAGGKLKNNRKNLAKWLRNPKLIKVTMMPNTGLSEEEIEILVDFFDTL